jgi:transcriptional regulator
MHPNPAFRGEPRERHLAFARTRAFGLLAVSAGAGPLLSHIPFLLNDDGTEAHLHLVRSNPIAQLAPGPAVIAVSGPDGYVSPDWYGVPDQVPTWNYVAVHLRGRLEPLPVDAMHALLDRQSAHFEAMLAPKTPWTTGKMTPGVMERMMRAILPFRLVIDSVDGTWKLGQNKDAAARLGAADRIESGTGHELGELADLMRGA